MSKILFVPWRQIESIEHYAARRDLPKIKNSLGEWTVDYKNVQDHRAWSKMLKPLKNYEVVNVDIAKHQAFSNKGEEQKRKQNASLDDALPGQEYKSKNRKWIDAEEEKGKKVWTEVWYAGRVSPIIFSLRTADEQIYIRGHGQPGETKISSGKGNWSLAAKEVAKRLIESGLQPSFAGKIKCYNCHSADSGIGESFAQAFSDYMYYSEGYRSCEYWGYYGALDSYPGASDAGSNPDDASSLGKTSKTANFTAKHKTSLSEDGLSRASARRKLIIPKVPKELLAELEKKLAKLKPF
jgi:hypothetical protein